VIARDLGNLPADPPHPGAYEPAPGPEPVGIRDRGRVIQPPAQLPRLGVEMGVERQLLRDEQRRDEDDAGAAVRRKPAGEVERVLRLLPTQQRHDDAPEARRGRPPHEAPDTAREAAEIEALHRSSW